MLKEGVLTTAELFVNCSMTPFQHSYRGWPAPLRGKSFSIRNTIADFKENKKERDRFYNLLVNLRRDGLIVKDPSGKKKGWFISKRGMSELESRSDRRYLKNASKEVVVVSYDIPEKYRSERSWLRSILRLLDFKMMHQSVWIGKTEIPETLVRDFNERKIATFVHVFAISRTGSLTQIL